MGHGQRDRSWATRSATPMSFGSKTRTTASISFGLRTRSVLDGSILGGDDLDGGASAGVRSQWWCDLDVGDGAGVLATPLLGCNWFTRWVTLSSLSLSLCVSETWKWFVVKIKM